MPKPHPDAKNSKKKFVQKQQRIQKSREEINALENAVASFDPSASTASFSSLPLSLPTQKGLKKAFFTTPTDVQRLTVPPALQGRDIFATARTGSGKTLAFLIPLVEVLYRNKWGPQDGLGAVVISPTRELAVQTFEVLRKIGGYHGFSAGLVIGGKNVQDESARVSKMNILVATPGRLLQHLDQAVGFEVSGLKVLVLDEADRILDMGFSRSINAIIDHFPKSTPDKPARQTLLFSATKSSSMDQLARLSLVDPMYIHVNEDGDGVVSASKAKSRRKEGDDSDEDEDDGETATDEEKTAGKPPSSLSQHYSLVPLERKLDVLWSFIKTHLKAKCIVFVTCTKQARYIFRTFSALQPGTPLLHLHGHQTLPTRLSVFQKFARSSASFLIATDVASRGLDFPAVDWVFQLDCPEDVDAYVHRVGRTARYEKGGNALLLLTEGEKIFLDRVKKRGVDIEEIKIREGKIQSIANKLQLQAWRDVEIKYLAQRAFISYVRSVHLQKDKDVFSLEGVDLKAYAESMGLVGAPKVKFLNSNQKAVRQKDFAASKHEDEDSGEESEEETNKKGNEKKVRTKYDRMFGRTNQNVLSEHYHKLVERSGSGGEDDEEQLDNHSDHDEDFITLARADHELSSSEEEDLAMPAVSRMKKKIMKAQSSLIPFDLHQPAPLPGMVASTSTLLDVGLTEKEAHLSKRALKAGTSRKAMLKNKPGPTKILFSSDSEDGVRAKNIWENVDIDPEEGRELWEERGREFVKGLEDMRKDEDVRDREEARENRRAKKRAMKEKEREMRRASSGAGGVAVLGKPGDGEDDDGYVSPDFDIPPLSRDEEEEVDLDERPRKKPRLEASGSSVKKKDKGGMTKSKRVDRDEPEWGGIGGDDLERMALEALGQ